MCIELGHESVFSSYEVRGGLGRRERSNMVSMITPELEQKDSNETCNPRDVKIHIGRVETAEVEERDYGI